MKGGDYGYGHILNDLKSLFIGTVFACALVAIVFGYESKVVAYHIEKGKPRDLKSLEAEKARIEAEISKLK